MRAPVLVLLLALAVLAGCKRGNRADYFETPPSPGPDLVLGEVTLSSNPIRAGQSIRVFTEIRNIGSLDAVGPFAVTVRWSNGAVIYDETKWILATIPAGTAYVLRWDVQPTLAGTLDMMGVIDEDADVIEMREYNNQIVQRFVVASSG